MLSDAELTKHSVVLPVPHFRQLLQDPRLLLAFGFGSGLSPIMPGTMGTLVALPIYYLMAPLNIWLYIALVVLSILIGNYLCGYAAKKLKVHDHPGIVWDEFAGMWITMIAVPFNWQTLLAGFVLFRIFDMVKPWPISLADKHIHGGVGIMFDDVLAGFAALACLHGALYMGWLM
ncbi:phosphatidylglycerophosphatase A family protein [Saccharophagus degradans]|uniref:phosphatidylglycerophosphatase A family protein n=1 Tax=Saccharophagus degradans TaxID=86304 RepID=UPI003A7F77BB